MKKWISLFLVLVMILALAACGTGNGASNSGTAETQTSRRIAAVFPPPGQSPFVPCPYQKSKV